ncbi:MAG: multiheme c-type cytochrome [Mangrovibacterium sp.]
MNPDKQRTYRLYLMALIAILIPLFVLKQLFFPANTPIMGNPEYVGRETCVECHDTEMNDFMGSHHDLAMDYANDSTVLADFNNAELHRSNGEVNKAFKKDGKFFVITDGEDGSMKEYEVKYVFGHYPLQNYLVEFPGGRLQVLALTWSTIHEKWYYMPDSIPQYAGIDHNNWLHWTNQAQNWNSMCAYCHTTGFQKNYDPETDSYQTSWSEIDVSCEACHGPASNHLKWANLPEYAQKDYENFGLVTPTSGLESNEQYVEMCARCHSRRASFSDQIPHNIPSYDFMQMALPQRPLWHVDGQIHDEDYVAASFMQSKMFQRGVQCNDCHNVHSGERKMEGNDLCFQCHNQADYDTYEHHHHKYAGDVGEPVKSIYGDTYDVGSGTQCVNCHMPAQYYMGVDLRNDHSFRVPRPDLSDKLNSPNACTQCHADESNQWAAQHVAQWHGKPYKEHWGEVILAANNGGVGADSALLKLIDSDTDVHANIVRATALATLNYDEHPDVIQRYLTDENDMMRNTAINAIEINSSSDAQKVFPLLNDSRIAIRATALIKLLDYPKDQIPENYRNAFNNALEDYGNLQKYNADFPLSRFGLGSYYTVKSEMAKSKDDSLMFFAKAEACFLAAYRQDSLTHEFALHLAYHFNKKGDLQQADNYFQAYLNQLPNDAQANYDYGLLLSAIAAKQMQTLGNQQISLEQKKQQYEKSLLKLEKAIELDPQNPGFNYNNISQIYLYYGNAEKAEQVLVEALKNRNQSLNDYINLFNFHMTMRDRNKAGDLAKEILSKFPDNPDVQALKTMF